MDSRLVGQRIKEERDRAGLSQEDLSEKAGLSNRQAVAAIEDGKRDVKLWEVLNIARVLKIEPAQLYSSHERSDKDIPIPVLWRKEPANCAEHEKRFVQCIRHYSLLERVLGAEVMPTDVPVVSDFELAKFTFHQVYALAEKIRSQLGLGNEPACALPKVLEDHLGIKILYENLSSNGSAATSKSGMGLCILLNADEAPWRRNFSLAHEFFHLITWNEKLIETVRGNSELSKRNEQFAEAFAAGLLMPSEYLRSVFSQSVTENKISFSTLIALSRQFEVSTTALLWRLKFIGCISESTVTKILSDPSFKEMDKADMSKRWDNPKRLSERFVRLAYRACEQGKISRAKIASMLGTSLVDLSATFEDYGFTEAGNNEVAIA